MGIPSLLLIGCNVTLASSGSSHNFPASCLPPLIYARYQCSGQIPRTYVRTHRQRLITAFLLRNKQPPGSNFRCQSFLLYVASCSGEWRYTCGYPRLLPNLDLSTISSTLSPPPSVPETPLPMLGMSLGPHQILLHGKISTLGSEHKRRWCIIDAGVVKVG